MLLKTKQILEQADYYIQYSYLDNEQGAEIYISWENKRIHFQYDTDENILLYKTDKEIIEIPCLQYIVPCIIDMLLRHIANSYNYDPKLIIKFYKNNPCVDTLYDIKEDEKDKFLDVNELYINMIYDGVRPDHFILAEEHGILDGYKTLSELYLGINIDIPNK